MSSTVYILKGQTLSFDPVRFARGPEAAHHHRHGAVVIEGGKILWVGPDDQCPTTPGSMTIDYGDKLIMAGFVDAHVHYPQTGIIASWGKRLIDWLKDYTFPEEARFGNPTYAEDVASCYFDLTLAHGTTTTCSYGTIHPESVDAYMAAAQSRGLRALIGKTCMDRNAQPDLLDTAQSAYDDSKALLEKWHGVDRLEYVITPRFSPTSTPGQLDALGSLWSEYPNCLMQTHLSEQMDEVAWVKKLFPEARDYLDTYDAYGLLGDRAIFGHAIHLSQRERAHLKEVGAALIHCPTSNSFIGSGIFDMAGLSGEGQRIGLASDTGGGSSFSMLRTMANAYELGQLNGAPLHPATLLWLATAGSAQALHLGDKIGNLAAGMEADIAVLDLASTPAIAQRHSRAACFWESIFPTIMMGDDRAISDLWIAGQRQSKPN